jgi:hypothetical protein
MGDWVPSSLQLRNIRLGGWYERMPTRISSSLLPLVCYLDINVHQVRLEDIQVLGTLPALRVLHVLSDVDTATEEERATQRSFMLRVSPMFKSEGGHKLGPITCIIVNPNTHNA